MPPTSLRLAPIVLLGLLAGCDSSPSPKSQSKAMLRETVGKTTQDVRKLETELGQGGQAAATGITATDYITLQSDAYKTSVAKLAKMKVDMDIRQYEALNGEYPKTYEEFMDVIIKKGKPDGIQLPMLPFYQEYAYNEKTHELVVLEYPAKKAEYEKKRDAELGR